MTLLNMSFYGAVIILTILIIRAFTLHKLPKKTFLILWAVALVRLLVPFEIVSDLSLYSLLPEALIPKEQADNSTQNAENPYAPFEHYYDYLEHKQQTVITGESNGPVFLPTDLPDGEVVLLPDVDEEVLPAIGNTGQEPSDTSITIQELWSNLRPHLPFFWGIGALLCGIFFLISYLRCRLEFSTSLPVTEDYATKWLSNHPLKRTITFRQSDKISAPLTYGIFCPVILMPKKTDWNNVSQLDFVLYHEFTHIRRFDLLAKLVMIVAVCLHWFNPLVWIMYFFFNRDLELSCDDCVVKHFGVENSAYANTLIGMEEQKNFSTPLCNHFSKNAIEERITAIMKSKKTTIGMMIAAVVIVLIVVITLTTGRKDEDAASNLTPTPSEDSDSSVMMEYKEVLTPRIQEYLTMMNSCFLNNPPIAGEAALGNAVSIAGNTGFYPVDEEVFPSYDALIGYVKGICTEKHADELCRRYWLLDLNVLPNIGVLSGKAYTKQFQSTTYPKHFEITDIKENIKKYDDTTLSATFRFTEGTNPYYWGVLTFAKQDDTWYVSNVTLHRHPMDVSPTPTMSPDEYRELPPPWKTDEYEQEVTTLCQEQFSRYIKMQHEFFYTNLQISSGWLSSDDMITINGNGGYTKVLDERFPTLQSVIDYMETICTPDYAEYLRNQNWHMDTQTPTLAELDGELYTQCYDGILFGESYRFAPINTTGPDTCTLSYEAYIDIPSNKTESGTVTFLYTDGSWHVSNHTYTRHHDFLDGLDIQIMADLFSKYRTMWIELFNSNLECGYSSNPSPESVTINGISGYYKVLDERFPTMQNLIDYMETIYTPEFAAELRKKYYLTADSDYPLLTEMDGVLYTQVYHSSTNGYSQEFKFTDLQHDGSGTATVSYQTDGTNYPNIVEIGTITFRVMERGGWRLADLDYSYKNIATEGIFEDTPASPPTTTGPDWYDAVSELMHGNTPKNTTKAEQSFHANHGDLKYILPSNENGHVFTISNLVLWEEKNVVLKDVSLDLSPYTTRFIWRENGIYYNEPDGEIYVVFSPTLDEAKGGIGTVEYQVLLATIPQVGSENYTIRCYGNPESPLDLGGSHTYGTTKIDNLIYLGESRHGDTFYTIDTNTGKLTSLSYVNDALYAQAKSYLTECGLGTEFALSSHVVCKTKGCTVFSADISYSVDNSPTYFTVYHAYIGSELLGKVIFQHLIPFYDTINESHVNAMYISMDDVVQMAKEQFTAFYDSKSYTQPYKITSIHMTSFESIEVEFLLSESGSFDIYTEGEVKFTYDFQKELWDVSSFRETPPDYLTSFLEFPELAAEDVVVTGKDWCLTFLDETELPRFQDLMTAGGKLSTELIDDRFPEEGSHYIITLDGIGYYFYSNSAPKDNHHAWNVYLLSPDYPLSGGVKVGMTEQELLALYPDLAKTTLSGDDPAFNGAYGSDWFAFRNDQFPESFLKEYEYAYVAYLDKERDGLPVCIAFLMANGQVSAITEYMPTAN